MPGLLQQRTPALGPHLPEPGWAGLTLPLQLRPNRDCCPVGEPGSTKGAAARQSDRARGICRKPVKSFRETPTKNKHAAVLSHASTLPQTLPSLLLLKSSDHPVKDSPGQGSVTSLSQCQLTSVQSPCDQLLAGHTVSRRSPSKGKRKERL